MKMSTVNCLKDFNLSIGICRTCLKHSKELISLFNNVIIYDKSHSLSHILFTFTSIQVDDSEISYSKICQACLQILSDFFIFRQQCIEANSKLLSYLKENDKNEGKHCTRLEERDIHTKIENATGSIYSIVNVDRKVEEYNCCIDNCKSGANVNSSCKNPSEENNCRVQVVNETEENYCVDTFKEGSEEEDKNCAQLDVKSTLTKNNESKKEKTEICKIFENTEGSILTNAKVCNKTEENCSTHSCSNDYNCSPEEYINFCREKYNCSEGEFEESCVSDTGVESNTTDDIKNYEISKNSKLYYRCGPCKRTFSSKIALKFHLKEHTSNSDLKCKICSKQFTRASDVKRHMTQHTGEKPFKCMLCSASYTQSGTLAQHMRKHGQTIQKSKKILVDKPHLCSICGKSFKDSSSLTIHIRRHNNDRPYKCTVCEMRFVSSGRLTSHMRVHTGERPFECNICGKTFGQSSVASKHIKSHSGIRPYACTVCSKSFSTLYCLKIHKRKHTGEKPHICNICNKRFADPKVLKQHIKVHTGERSHLCSICGKGFLRNHHLKAHMNTHAKV